VSLKRFPWGLTVAVVPALALLIALGVWQVQRLAWKERLIDAAEAAAAQPPAPLATVLALHAPEFRKVVVTCPGLETAPFVELQSIHDGEAGVRLVSACAPRDFPAVFLIDRGFVADGISARPPVSPSTLPTTVLAEVREVPAPSGMAPPPSNGRFFARDSAAMARALNVADVDPNTLYALTSSNPGWAALRPTAPPAAFSNNHLGYALTWFGLAIALVGFYVALVWRRMRPA
jgi:surfeit locus 1 family protein